MEVESRIWAKTSSLKTVSAISTNEEILTEGHSVPADKSNKQINI